VERKERCGGAEAETRDLRPNARAQWMQNKGEKEMGLRLGMRQALLNPDGGLIPNDPSGDIDGFSQLENYKKS